MASDEYLNTITSLWMAGATYDEISKVKGKDDDKIAKLYKIIKEYNEEIGITPSGPELLDFCIRYDNWIADQNISKKLVKSVFEEMRNKGEI
jgi:hypothetical protein